MSFLYDTRPIEDVAADDFFNEINTDLAHKALAAVALTSGGLALSPEFSRALAFCFCTHPMWKELTTAPIYIAFCQSTEVF